MVIERKNRFVFLDDFQFFLIAKDIPGQDFDRGVEYQFIKIFLGQTIHAGTTSPCNVKTGFQNAVAHLIYQTLVGSKGIVTEIEAADSELVPVSQKNYPVNEKGLFLFFEIGQTSLSLHRCFTPLW